MDRMDVYSSRFLSNDELEASFVTTFYYNNKLNVVASIHQFRPTSKNDSAIDTVDHQEHK